VGCDDPVDVPTVTADSDDDYLVALALAAGADGIVSGDKHLPS
jgi:predicted nucleic acid-binding protein